MQGMLKMESIKKDSLKAMIEYAILISEKGDYILQALTLKDMNPQGF